MKYKKWIDKNCNSLKGKTVIVTGATGGIGFALLEELDYLDAFIIMAIRNKKKAEALLQNCNLKKLPKVMILDLENYQSIDSFISELSDSQIKVDYLVNNAGVYNLKSITSIHNHEIHLQVNTFSTIYLSDSIRKLNPNVKVIYVNSLSSELARIDCDNIERYVSNKSIKKYGATKLLCMCDVLNQNNSANVLIHPGIVFTPMLLGSWPKILKTICNPICKVLFMNPYKAALTILYAIDKDVDSDSIVLPRGLFAIWGYPKSKKINKRILSLNHESISKKIRAQMI